MIGDNNNQLIVPERLRIQSDPIGQYIIAIDIYKSHYHKSSSVSEESDNVVRVESPTRRPERREESKVRENACEIAVCDNK